ncbi:MAG: hypothetical protein H8D45_00535 [Bacteroidetes bacterium]|nr:hypothetical protein [Bacteroidota bacterium]
MKDKSEKYKIELMEDAKLKNSLSSGKTKIIYFEKFNNRRTAKARLRKIESLDRTKLVELIKGSNPEMLNLIIVFKK